MDKQDAFATTSGNLTSPESEILFPGAHLAMVRASIAAGNTAGTRWDVPQTDAGPLTALWDGGNGVYYLAGDVADMDAPDVLSSRLALHRRQLRLRRFLVRVLSPSLESNLARLFPDVSMEPSLTHFMTLDRDGDLQAVTPPPPGIDIRLIDNALLTGSGLEGIDILLGEIRSMWPSTDRFLTHGFGSVAVRDREIVCFCTSEYVGPAQCGIGIATVPDARNRGIATAVAAEFIAEARRRGLAPCWECRADNLSSAHVAEKLGFAVRESEPYWIVTEPS